MAQDLQRRTEQAVAKQSEEPTLRQLIDRMQPEIARALPKHMDADKVARVAITILNQSRQLQQCTAESFLGALMTASQLGLEISGPGGLGEAYLVPYKDKVTFIPGYKGLMKLAYQSGMVESIGAHVVHEKDFFDFEYGRNEDLKFRPFMDGERGKPVAVYADAKLKNGAYKFVVLSIDAVERLRAVSAAGQRSDSPWVKHWDAMARKSAIRQLIRWLPTSTEIQNPAMFRAVELDGSVRDEKVGAVHALDESAPRFVPSEAGDVDTVTGEVVEGELTDEPPEPEGWR